MRCNSAETRDRAERPIETHHTFCRICESLCGLVATVDGGRVVDVRPDDAHVATRGFSCPKGLRQHESYASPDRLLAPEKRTGDRWDRIGWDQALGEIGSKVRPDARDGGTADRWGHQHATGLSIASRTRGVNVNLLAADGPECIERVSGMAQLTGFPVTVRPADGPQDPGNWSGIASDPAP